MQINPEIKSDYFKLRNIDPTYYQDYTIPQYLRTKLPKDNNAKILDIGCGFGQMLLSLRQAGYKNLNGIDISEEAADHCVKKALAVEKINDIIEYAQLYDKEKYDFIIMSHVLEHIEKTNIISTLVAIREKLLNLGGKLAIMVPNAQSNTGCYWAYEDFTHTTLFTAGSLYYVLNAAGFDLIQFLDPYCLENMPWFKKIVKRFLLKIYIANNELWNRITSSGYHKPSPRIYSYEIKVLVNNPQG